VELAPKRAAVACPDITRVMMMMMMMMMMYVYVDWDK